MNDAVKPSNFIEEIIYADIDKGLPQDKLRFRFPPEPNGFLHIGHASAICLNFGLGEKFGQPVNLRFDDTNPAKEEAIYVDAIKRDVEWLGFKWDNLCYASDYFQELYDWTVQLIKDGKAYVDSQSSEEIAAQKGTPTEPGTESPYRNRSVDENLALFEGMKNGTYAESEHVVRAKINMQSTNMLMRDPIMYRVVNKAHHRTGTNWKIYPMYDWAHGQSDYLEQISHSFCTLEFLPHRELYDWFLDQIISPNILRPKQREFARRNVSHTVTSKRKLQKLVDSGIVTGWDDPRMTTISGLRRRGFTAASIRKFAASIGIAKRDNLVDLNHLEFHLREDLNKTANRIMCVLDPVKLVITNYPENKVEMLQAENNQEDESRGFRELPFSRELLIEREDFKEEANKKYFRLSIGSEVRLKNGYIIKGESCVKDAQGNITEIHASYDPDSRSGSNTPASLRRVKGTLHWVSASQAIPVEVRMYDRLFTVPAPDTDKERDFMDFINPDSLKVVTAFAEPSAAALEAGTNVQFQRIGYFCVDTDTTLENPVFNRTVGLRDTWAKVDDAL